MKQRRKGIIAAIFLLAVVTGAGGFSCCDRAEEVYAASSISNRGPKNQFVRKDGKWYYYDERGRLVRGWHTSKAGNRYYFWNDGVIRPGWQTVDGKLYYFNEKGKMLKNRFITVSGKKYYLGQNGQKRRGWMTLNGKTYCLHPKTGILQTGWVTYKDERYYLQPSTGILLKNQWIDQNHYVGADGAWIPGYSKMKLRWPLSAAWNTITSYFGNRESPGGIGSTDHGGIDIYAPIGTPIYAPADGFVITIQKPSQSNGGGKYTIIDHGNGIYTEYMHQSRFASGLKVGKRVNKGEVIGYVGKTGNVTGPHLHFGVMLDGVRRDPLKYVKRPE